MDAPQDCRQRRRSDPTLCTGAAHIALRFEPVPIAQAAHFNQLPNQQDGGADRNVPGASQQGHANRDLWRNAEQCADSGVAGLLTSISDPRSRKAIQLPKPLQNHPTRWTAIHSAIRPVRQYIAARSFSDATSCSLRPANQSSLILRPNRIKSGTSPFCNRRTAAPATNASTRPIVIGLVSDWSAERANRTRSPATANTISARNSAVRSTTIERVATDQEMPRNVAARTPSTKPPTIENGRQLPAESRTIRPQTNGARWRPPLSGAATRQPIPRTMIVKSCQAQNSANLSPPTESIALPMGLKPYHPTNRVLNKRPAIPIAIDRVFNGFSSRSPQRLMVAQALGALRQLNAHDEGNGGGFE